VDLVVISNQELMATPPLFLPLRMFPPPFCYVTATFLHQPGASLFERPAGRIIPPSPGSTWFFFGLQGLVGLPIFFSLRLLDKLFPFFPPLLFRLFLSVTGGTPLPSLLFQFNAPFLQSRSGPQPFDLKEKFFLFPLRWKKNFLTFPPSRIRAPPTDVRPRGPPPPLPLRWPLGEGFPCRRVVKAFLLRSPPQILLLPTGDLRNPNADLFPPFLLVRGRDLGHGTPFFSFSVAPLNPGRESGVLPHKFLPFPPVHNVVVPRQPPLPPSGKPIGFFQASFFPNFSDVSKGLFFFERYVFRMLCFPWLLLFEWTSDLSKRIVDGPSSLRGGFLSHQCDSLRASSAFLSFLLHG